MPRQLSTGPLALLPRQPYAGEIDFHLMNGRNWYVATIVIVAEPDTVTIRRITPPDTNAVLATIPRNEFRLWILRPLYPLVAGKTYWTHDSGVNLTLYTGLTYQLPADVTTRLRELM